MENETAGRYAYCFLLGDQKKWIYANSEVDARVKFKRWYHTEAGDLIERRFA